MKDSHKSISSYLDAYNLIFEKEYPEKISRLVDLINNTNTQNKRIYILGNGASAAIASHIANDLTKATKSKASTFHDPALITCFGNDFGYENWMKEALKHYAEEDDTVILISSSGRSDNVLNASNFSKEKNINLVSLTGPNPKKELINNSFLNFSVNSKIYNVIECIHMIILTSAIDQINMITLDLD